MRPAGPNLGLAYLLGAQLAVGAAAIFARFALTGAQPFAVSALRLAFASAACLTVMAVGKRTRQWTTTAQRGVLATAGICLAIHFLCWIASLQYTAVAVSTLLVCTTPLWTALYDAVVLRKKLSLIAWLGFASGGAGLLLVVQFNLGAPPVPGHALFGNMLALAGAFAIGAYFILVREVRAALSTVTIVTWTYTVAALGAGAAAIAARQPPPALSATTAWGGIIAMALISQLIGHTGLNAALRYFSPSTISFTTLLEPVFAALLAAAIFGERLSQLALFGGLIVLAAIAVVLNEERRAGEDRL